MAGSTLTLTVTETVQYRGGVLVTEALLDEAEEYGFARSTAGVATYLNSDTDHAAVLAIVEDDTNFLQVTERLAENETGGEQA